MAGALKGITVEIGGNTTKLGKALKDVDTQTRGLQKELKDVNKLLKLDPGNAELLAQKQEILAKAINNTKEKLETLKSAQQQVEEQFKRGEIGEEQYRAFQREIQATENQLKSFEGQQAKASSAFEELKNTINRQEKELEQLKRQYKDTVAAQGSSSEKAQELARRIQSLNNELNNNKEKLQNIEKATDDLTDSMEELGEASDTAGEVMKGSLQADIIEGLADKTKEAAADMFDFGVESQSALNILQSQTGATSSEMEGLKNIMHEIYADNFGGSMEEIAEAMAIVQQQTGLTGQELKNMTEQAFLLSDTFDMDVNESVRTADMMMQQFGLTSEQAYNLIAQGAQNGLNKNDDLLDTINEYSVHFKNLGLGAEDMFNMLINGAESGTFSVDKLGDAVKEFGIRVKDGTANDAFKELGLNVDETVAKFGKGGESAKQALSEVTTALFNIEDPIKQNQLGVQMFGSMWEDLGAEGVKALMDISGNVDVTKDKLGEINKVRYNDLGSALEGLKRTFQEALAPAIEIVVNAISDLVNCFNSLPGPVKTVIASVGAIAGIAALVVTVFGQIGLAIGGLSNLINVFIKIGPMATKVFGALKTGFLILKTLILDTLVPFITGTVIPALQGLWATLMANPIILVVAAIAALVAGFIYLWNNCEGFRNFWKGLWEDIKNACGPAIEGIKQAFQNLLPQLTGIWNGIVTFFTGIGNVLKGIFNGDWSQIAEGLVQIWTGIRNTCVALWSAIGQLVMDALSGLGTWIGDLWNSICTWVSDAWNNIVTTASQGASNMVNAIISFFTNLPSTIWYWLVFCISYVVLWTAQMVQKGIEAGSKFISNVVKFIQQLPGKVWTFLSNTISKAITFASRLPAKAQQAGSKFLNNVVRFIQQLPSRVWTFLSNTISKAISFASQFASKGMQAARNFASKIKNGLANLPNQMVTIGKNIIQGIIRGIGNGAGALFNKMKSIASDALNAAKGALGIHSPSRKFADEVGKYIPEGISVGIKLNAKNTLDAIKDFSSSLTGAIDANKILDQTGLATASLNINSSVGNDLGSKLEKVALGNKIDYDKLGKTIIESLSKNNQGIYMNNELVGIQTANSVRKQNSKVENKMNRLGGKLDYV